jgi:hypothetical protein
VTCRCNNQPGSEAALGALLRLDPASQTMDMTIFLIAFAMAFPAGAAAARLLASPELTRPPHDRSMRRRGA